MWKNFTAHLYVRIWLAVVAAVAVLSLLMVGAWRLSREDQAPPPVREVVVRNEAGEVIGRGFTRPERRRGQMHEFDVVTRDGQRLEIELPRPPYPGMGGPPGHGGPGMRPPLGLFGSMGFVWMLVLVGLAVALGAYPIIRRLTQRLEGLQRGVEQWGSGDLSARVPVQGSDEVAFLAERFNHAAERLQNLMNTQQALLGAHKTLLANASHELRSPLARIRMSLELMDGASTAPEAAAAQKAEIARSIQELDQLIDEILLASRLDARQQDAEPMDWLDLTGLAAEECARANAELVAELPAEGASSPGLMLRGSARLLRRLLRNLLENAKRYGGGDISLALSLQGAGSEQVAVVRVNDRGPGVPPEQRSKIFEPFYRLPGASEREGGVGLGLALVKSIAKRHGGSVRCEDRTGGGASFVVVLPVNGSGAS